MPDEPKPTLANMRGVKSRLHEQGVPVTLPVDGFKRLKLPDRVPSDEDEDENNAKLVSQIAAEIVSNIEAEQIKQLSSPNRTAHTVMVTCRMPYEMDRRLTALAEAKMTTKTALMLAAVERLLRES